MAGKQGQLFEQRMTMEDSIAMSRDSLRAYGSQYDHWAVAYSGGKDSTATVTVLAHLLATGQVPAPKSLTVLYADTRMELPPLHITAMELLESLEVRGITTRVVLPPLDKRFMVYMLGRGVPPPKNRFRWCTGQIKVQPMENALMQVREEIGEKLLMITGVRLGESAARDDRIVASCSKDGAECGQGWFQQTASDAVTDVLAPLVHWRVCHVWDWLMFHAPDYGFPTANVAEAYGGEEAEEINARTGCVGCNLASKDVALEAVIQQPQWAYLEPFMRLKPLYRELKEPRHRIRKNGERKKDGTLSSAPQRMGPLHMEARRWALGEVLSIQREINEAAHKLGRPVVSLINAEEQARIEELIAANTWPNGWDGDEVRADVPLDQIISEDVMQPLLFKAL